MSLAILNNPQWNSFIDKTTSTSEVTSNEWILEKYHKEMDLLTQPP